MKKSAMLLMLLFIVCTGAGCGAQASDSKEWDILGVKLGMSLDEATSVLKSAVPPRTIEPLKVKFTSFTSSHFTTPELITGARDLSYGNQLYIACDLAHPGTIMSLSRLEYFQTKPSFDIVYKSLVDKYGKPDFQTMPDKANRMNSLIYVWFTNANISMRTSEIEQNIGAASALSSGNYVGAPWTIIPEGKIMFYHINLDGDVVSYLACGFVDTDRVVNSCEYIKKVLADGDASEAAKAKIQGDQAKPKF
jgi:hypothetical protein